MQGATSTFATRFALTSVTSLLTGDIVQAIFAGQVAEEIQSLHLQASHLVTLPTLILTTNHVLQQQGM